MNLYTNNGKYLKYNGEYLKQHITGTNTYTAEYVGLAASYMAGPNTEYSIELQPNTYNIQYSAHFVLAQANRYNCKIGLYKSTEPDASEYVNSASYSAVSEDTKIVDMSGTLEIDTSIGYNRFFALRDGSNVVGRVSATITAQYYV